MSEQRQLSLSAMADGSQIRTAMFNGKQNLVVPVVALLGNAVVRPMNSRGAEFVPEKELSSSPAGWNGRPIVPDHPDGGRASANSPTVLESQAFGRVFGARYEDGRLKMEAWLDPARADKVGPLAQEVIRRCREGKMVEVSVGVWVTANQKKGSHNGADYEYEWSQIVPDHLAMLPEGVPGACSVKMGCGAPRSLASEPEALGGAGSGNFGHSGRPGEVGGSGGGGGSDDDAVSDSRHKSESEAIKAESSAKARLKGDGWQQKGQTSNYKVRGGNGSRTEFSKPNGDTAVVERFGPFNGKNGPKGEYGVTVVKNEGDYRDDTAGAEAIKNEYAPKREAMMKNPRTYEKKDPRAFSDGYSAMSQTETLTHVYTEALNYEGISRDAYIAGAFTADRDMVRTTSNGRHSPMGKMDKGTGYFDTKKKRGLSSGEGCSCSKDQGHGAPPSGVKKGVNMSGKINTLVERVLASKSNVFDEDCREHLESLGEDRLAVLADKLDAEAAPPAAPEKVEEPKPLTEEEKLAALPEEVKAMAAHYRALDKAERDNLITSLGKAQKVFPKEALDLKPTDELRSLATLLKIDEPVPDYSGRLQPVQRAAAGADSALLNPPDPWGLQKNAAS